MTNTFGASVETETGHGREVAITSTSFGKISDEPFEILRRAGLTPRVVPGPHQGEALVKALSGAVAAIIGTDSVSPEVLARLPGLRVLVRHGAGLDNVPVEEALRRGIRVARVPAASTNAVAELAVALMLSLARRVPEAAQATRGGGWPRIVGTELTGKTCGIVGFGKIGQTVAQRLAGFEMTLLAYDPMLSHERASALGVRPTGLDDLLRSSDFVTLHMPLTPETEGFIGPRELALMKPEAYLINTARGALVDEAALAQALSDGRLAGAAVDVFSQEPPGEASPLLRCPRLIPTPHMGAYTNEALNNVSRRAAEHVVALLRGDPCPDEVTLEG